MVAISPPSPPEEIAQKKKTFTQTLCHLSIDTETEIFLSGEFQPCNYGYWSKLGGICQNGRLSGKKMFHPTKIHTWKKIHFCATNKRSHKLFLEEKRFIFQKVGCTDVAMKKARTAALFGFETGMLGKMSQPGHHWSSLLCKCFS